MVYAVHSASDLPSASGRPRAPGEASVFWSLVTWCIVVSFLVVGGVLTVLIGGAAALLGDRSRKVAHTILTLAYNGITRVHPTYRITVTGKENLPEGPCILCPNHQSYSDVVYLYSMRLQFRFVVKRELFWVPLFGPAMWVAKYPKIDRGDTQSAQRMMSQVQEHLRAGVSVLTFPEGSRSASGELGRFHRGAARMAVQAQVPLVPVGITGTARLLPKGSIAYPARAHIWIHIGPPIATQGKTRQELGELTRALREGVRSAKQLGEAKVQAEGF